MGLHIEISGDATHLEWSSLAVLAAAMLADNDRRIVALEVLRGEVQPVEPIPFPVAKPVAELAAEAATEGTNEARALADRLMAAESARVANAGPPELPMIAPAPGVPVDADGLPHDLRIHASTGTKTKEKRWTKKRRVDPVLVQAVEAELRQAMAAVAPNPAPIPEGPAVLDPAAAFGAPVPAAGAPLPPSGTGAPPPPPVEDPAPPPPPPTNAAPAGDFPRIMQLVVSKGVPTSVATEIAQSLGLSSIRDLAHRPDMIPSFEALLP